MSLAKCYSRANLGMDAPSIIVETHIAGGLPAFNIVGLAETAVKESRERVRSAIINSHFEFPAKRITINLAPADLPKAGGRFDLPIALSILAASGQIENNLLHNTEFIGELALNGDIKSCRAIASALIHSGRNKRNIVIPKHCAEHLQLVQSAHIFCAKHLLEVCSFLNGKSELQALSSKAITNSKSRLNMSEVQGQQNAKRALEIAAAGEHALLMNGPPGSGKSMLAERFHTILPPLEAQQASEVALIESIQGKQTRDYFCRPYRAPHHSASTAALIGGGPNAQPGEISLAHHGVLFLDELPEFARNTLDALREPVETGEIHIARAKRSLRYPCQFQLIAAMNPCPCGWYGDAKKACAAYCQKAETYKNKISGPMLDRFDIKINVQSIQHQRLLKPQDEEKSELILKRVCAARERQLLRQQTSNGKLSNEALNQYCALSSSLQDFYSRSCEKLGLSSRATIKTLRVARSIADLAGRDAIEKGDLLEALSYR